MTDGSYSKSVIRRNTIFSTYLSSRRWVIKKRGQKQRSIKTNFWRCWDRTKPWHLTAKCIEWLMISWLIPDGACSKNMSAKTHSKTTWMNSCRRRKTRHWGSKDKTAMHSDRLCRTTTSNTTQDGMISAPNTKTTNAIRIYILTIGSARFWIIFLMRRRSGIKSRPRRGGLGIELIGLAIESFWGRRLRVEN